MFGGGGGGGETSEKRETKKAKKTFSVLKFNVKMLFWHRSGKKEKTRNTFEAENMLKRSINVWIWFALDAIL